VKLAIVQTGRSRVIGLVAVAAVSSGAALTGSAIAHTHVYSNAVKVNKAPPGVGGLAIYSGRVTSPKHRCRVHREVQVYHANPNPDVRLGTRITTPGGKWKLKAASVPNGHQVYALIETKVLKQTANHDHTCAVDRSPDRTVPYP
jgi:hypothetical protein